MRITKPNLATRILQNSQRCSTYICVVASQIEPYKIVEIFSLQIKNPLQRLVDLSQRFSVQLATNFHQPVTMIDRTSLQAVGHGFF